MSSAHLVLRKLLYSIVGTLVVVSSPLQGQMSSPARLRSPTVTYTGIAPDNVIAGYVDALTRTGFSIKRRELIESGSGEKTLLLTLSFNEARPPYDSLYEFHISPGIGADPHRLTEVSLARKYITGADRSHEKEDLKLGREAAKALTKALSEADAAMGPHQRPPQYMQSW